MTKDKTVKINIGYWFHLDGAERFCQEHFGPGGVQADRRWFYRLLDLKRPRGNFGRLGSGFAPVCQFERKGRQRDGGES